MSDSPAPKGRRAKAAPVTQENPVSETAPTQVIKVGNLQLTVPKPYNAGHVLNENEASALNQTFAENIRNNTAGRIRAKLAAANKDKPEDEHIDVDGLDQAELMAELAEYANSYTFAQRAVRAPSDPVGAEARKIAKAKILEAMRSKNIDVKSISAERMEANIAALLDKYPQIREEAARRVAEAKSLASDLLDLV